MKMSVITKWFKLDLVTSGVKQNNGKECLLYRFFLCTLFYYNWASSKNWCRKKVQLLSKLYYIIFSTVINFI